MTIYLSYITNYKGERLTQHDFTQACIIYGFSVIDVEVWMSLNNWKLDQVFGIDMDEAVNMAKARYEFDNGRHYTSAADHFKELTS